MAQIFNTDINIGSFTKASATTAQLAASKLPIGGKMYTTNALTLNTALSGAGGIDTGSVAANSFYYAYVVVDNGVVKLIASLSEIKPVGFNAWYKVGAFFVDGNSFILHMFDYNIENSTGYQDITAYANAERPMESGGSLTGSWNHFHYEINNGVMNIRSLYLGANAGSGGLAVYFRLPYGLTTSLDGFCGPITTYQVIHITPTTTEYQYTSGNNSGQQVSIIRMGAGGSIVGSDINASCQIIYNISMPILGFPDTIDWKQYNN